MPAYPGYYGIGIVETYWKVMNLRVIIKAIDAPSVIQPQEKDKSFTITSISYAREGL